MYVCIYIHLFHLFSDPGIMFQTSLACSRLLLCVPNGVVMEMLQYNRTLMCVATLMYAPAPLEEASSSDLCFMHVQLYVYVYVYAHDAGKDNL